MKKSLEGNDLESRLETGTDQKLCLSIWNKLGQNREDIQQTIESRGLSFSCIREIFSKTKDKYSISIFTEGTPLVYEFYLIKQTDHFDFIQVDKHPPVTKEMAHLLLEALAGKEQNENKITGQIQEVKGRIDSLQLE